jgi:hypothetical protein
MPRKRFRHQYSSPILLISGNLITIRSLCFRETLDQSDSSNEMGIALHTAMDYSVDHELTLQ